MVLVIMLYPLFLRTLLPQNQYLLGETDLTHLFYLLMRPIKKRNIFMK